MSAAAAAEAPPAAKGGKKTLIIIGAAVAVLLLGGGGAALVLLKKPAEAEGDEATAQVSKDKPKAKSAAPARDPKAIPAFVPLDPFTVNLADKETERYAQVALTLEVDDVKTGDQVKNYMPAVRNNILMLLSHKTSTELLELEGKRVLAEQIKRETARALGYVVEDSDEEEDEPKKKKRKKKAVEQPLPVLAVHFSNFIVQ